MKEKLHPSEFDGVIGNTERNKSVFLPKMHPFSLVLFYLLFQDSIHMIISIFLFLWTFGIYVFHCLPNGMSSIMSFVHNYNY